MNINDKKYEIISAYLDNELSEEENLRVEEMISSSLEMQKKLEDYKLLKSLTQSVKRISPSQYFETRLMAELETPQSGLKKLIKYSPVAGLIVITIGIMALLKFNPGFMENIWETQKSNIAGFYKENLQPLLYASNLTNEDLFNFAFNQELPLDKKKNQFLMLGYDKSGNEIVEIKTHENLKPEQNYDQFIEALDLNASQKLIVDSVIRSYAEAIVPQILVNDNNTVAINPTIWSYRNAMVADLLVLAKDLKKEKALNIIPANIDKIEKIHITDAVNKLKSLPEHQYIFLTPDSIFEEDFVYDFKKHKEEINNLQKNINEQKELVKNIEINIRYDSTWKNIENRPAHNEKYKVKVGDNYCQVEFSNVDIPELQLPDMENLNLLIKEATDNIRFQAFHIPRVEKVQKGMVVQYIDDNDSLKSYQFNYHDIYMDSLLHLNRLMLDSLMRSERQKNPMFSDSVLSRWFFNPGENFYQFNPDELREQMQELQEEFRKFREEMNNWKNEVRTTEEIRK